MEVPARDAAVLAEADVVVAGGGPAGTAAALAAARAGARTVLCERYGFLGGNLTAASVGTICGLYAPGDRPGAFDFVVGGVGREVAERLSSAGAGAGPVPFKETAVFVYTPWAAKRLMDHLVADEPRLEVLLHSLVSDVLVDPGDGSIRAVVLATKRGPVAVRGSAFVDCTGDADLAAFAGVPTTLGPPGARQFSSMQFVLEHASDGALASVGEVSELIRAHGAELSRDGGALIPTLRAGEYVGAMTRVANADGTPIDVTDIRQATWGELEGRRLAEQAAAWVRANVPGFEESFLSDTACALGVRETRRVRGEYVLTGDDVASGARFDDSVAVGAWPQEYHVRGRSTEYVFLPRGVSYQIPFRALRPVGVPNLLVAGRCISADHDALASTRVMGPCMALGQAAGLAAALAAAGSSGRTDVVGVPELQSALRARGARVD